MLEKNNNFTSKIELLSQMIEQDDCSFVKPEYRQAFQIGRLDTLLMIKEMFEFERSESSWSRLHQN